MKTVFLWHSVGFRVSVCRQSNTVGFRSGAEEALSESCMSTFPFMWNHTFGWNKWSIKSMKYNAANDVGCILWECTGNLTANMTICVTFPRKRFLHTYFDIAFSWRKLLAYAVCRKLKCLQGLRAQYFPSSYLCAIPTGLTTWNLGV